MLNRMVEQKYLDKLPRPHATLDFMYALKQMKWKPLALSNYDHERDAADIYVSCKTSGSLEEWVYYPKEFKRIRLEPDRRARLLGKLVYIEVDRYTEPLSKIEAKVKKYISVSNPDERFYVIFTAPDGTRAESILQLLEGYRRGNQFLVSLHEWMATNPLGQVYVSPKDFSRKQSLAEIK